VAGELPLDTGAWVSLLDRGQRRFREFAEFFTQWRGPVVSTEAVLTEATHLLSRIPQGALACLDLVLSGGTLLVPLSPAALRRARALMDHYSDTPMEFADATLVVLAEDLQTDLVLTTDRRDFSVYRIAGRKPFSLPV
jgi:uncharacterized protein